MKAVIGYLRCSTAMQTIEAGGVSLETQKAKVEAWALANDCEVAAFYVDAGLSGSKMGKSRPELQRALDHAVKGKLPLVVHSLSRLSRNISDSIAVVQRLQKAGSTLVSVSEKVDLTTAAGSMFFHMLCVFSQGERAQLAERVKGAMSYLKRQGKRVGAVPFGFDLGKDGKTLNENSIEQGVWKKIRAMSRKGMSLRGISGALNERGIKTKTGKAWHPETIRYMLKSR